MVGLNDLLDSSYSIFHISTAISIASSQFGTQKFTEIHLNTNRSSISKQPHCFFRLTFFFFKLLIHIFTLHKLTHIHLNVSTTYLFIYFWLCWVFVSVRGLSLVAASGGHSSSRCAGLSLSWPLLLRSTGSRRAGSVAVAHGPSRSAACGIFPDQGSNPCPLEPVSPALAGRLPTTAPPGKP